VNKRPNFVVSCDSLRPLKCFQKIVLFGVILLACACQGEGNTRPQMVPSGVLSTSHRPSQFLAPSQRYDPASYVALQSASEFPLSSLGTSVNSAIQDTPAIAFDGLNYLLVWQDGRNAFWQGGIYGTRIDASGKSLDSGGIEISPHSGEQYTPALAFDGFNYVVVWRDTRSDNEGDIYGARLSPAGQLLDPAGIPLATVVGQQNSPQITSLGDGTSFLVYSDWRSGVAAAVYGARLTAALQVLDPDGIALSSDVSSQLTPAVANNGSEYLAFWAGENSSELTGQRIDSSGVVFPGADLVVSGGAGTKQEPALSFQSGQYVLAWQDTRNGDPDIYATRLTVDGFPLDPAHLGIAVQPNAVAAAPSVASAASSHLILWQDTQGNKVGIHGATLTQAAVGAPVPYQKGTSCGGASPALSSGALGYVIAWSAPNCDGDVSVQLLDGTGAKQSNAGVVSVSGVMETEPALAAGTSNYLAAWQSHGGGRYNIHVRSFNPFGAPLGTGSITLTQNFTFFVENTDTAIGSANDQFMVAWTRRDGNSTTLQGAHVANDGSIISSGLGFGAVGSSVPALASNGNDYLLVFEQTSGETSDIYGQRLSLSGGSLSQPFAIAAGMGEETVPKVASDGSDYLLTYTDVTAGKATVNALRLASDATILDSSALLVGDGVEAAGGRGGALVAHGLNHYLVLWTGSDASLNARRLASDGSFLDATPLVAHQLQDTTRKTALTYDGTVFVISWNEAPLAPQPNYDIFARRLAADGSWLDTTPLTLNASAESETPSAIASNGTGNFFLLMSRFDHGASANHMRLYGQTFNWLVQGTACQKSSDCISGHCVDDVCCENDCGGGAEDCQACSVKLGSQISGRCEFVTQGTVCRPASGVCDQVDVCDGVTGGCPNNLVANGTVCDENAFCFGPKSCREGVCEGLPLVCPPPPVCYTAGPCNPSTGVCSYQQEANGAPCDLGMCLNGICVPLAGDGSLDSGATDGDMGGGDANDASVEKDASVNDLTDSGLADSVVVLGTDSAGEGEGCGCGVRPGHSGGGWVFILIVAMLFCVRRRRPNTELT
jgi:MYXO-CTERM domain-containing protein